MRLLSIIIYAKLIGNVYTSYIEIVVENKGRNLKNLNILIAEDFTYYLGSRLGKRRALVFYFFS